MSLKKIDRHFVGGAQGGNYQMYFQFVNLPTGYYVQGTVYKSTMEVYATLPRFSNTLTPTDEFKDTPEFVQVTTYMKLLGEIEWDEAKQLWEGDLTIGKLTIMKKGGVPFGWDSYRTTYSANPTLSTFATSLYGLLHIGSKPMRVFQTGSLPFPTNTFLMRTEPHTMDETPPYFDNSSVNVPPDNIGTWTLHAVYWTPYIALGGSNGLGGQWLGYRSFQYEENVQYNKRTKAIVNKVITTTQLTGSTNPDHISLPAASSHFQNRRRYHQIPEEEWFHTSCNPKIIHAGNPNTSAFKGFTEFEYGGDIESAGCAVATLPWGTLGVTGGNSFLTQIDYDWTLGTPDYQSIGHPPGVTKFIDVRRWIWKGLDITHPRVKIQITTPDGTATTCWVGVTPIKVDAGNGLTGAGQAWPADDKAPDYAGQGAPGRVPDLQVLPVTSLLTPDSGVVDQSNNSLYLNIGNQNPSLSGVQPISRSANAPDYMGDLDIQIVDTSKMAGWSLSINKVQPAQTDIHTVDRYTYNDWLSLPRFVWGWPKSMMVTVSGLSYSQANGTWDLPLRNPSAEFINTVGSGQGTSARYGKSLYGVPVGGLLNVFLVTASYYGPYMRLAFNGPVDPLVGRSGMSFYLNGRVNFMGPITLPITGTPGASVTLVPS